MQKQKGFLKIEERTNGDNFWNAFPVEILGGNILKSGGDIIDISSNLQIFK